MDISMMTAPTAVNSTATPATGTANQQAVNASGKSQAASKGGLTFTQLLDGQMKQESITVPTDAAMTLAGLIQMLQSLTLPIQNVVQTQNKSETAGGLPVILLKAMNSNEALANKLLQDPNLIQWFQQTQEILGALSGNDAVPVKAAGIPQSALNTKNLQAQNTLLTLASMLKEQPNNAVLQHITQDLQKLIEPLLPQLALGLNPAPASQNPAADPAGFEAAGNQAIANGLPIHKASMKQSGPLAASQPDAGKQSYKSDEGIANVVTVQPVKSQLEWLAAKNAVNASYNSLPITETKQEQLPQLTADPTASNSPILQFTDMLKAPLPTEAVVKPATQTIYAANFAQDMTEHMLKNMKITLADGISEAKLSLFPKNLGHVDVKITMHEGHLTAQFAADSLAGKQMLESQLPQLRQSLQSQGLLVEKLEVTQNLNTQSGMFQDQRQGQWTGQNFRPTKSKSSASYELDNVEFIQQLSSAAQMRSAAYNNSFDVTA
ncbi:flagellar hook-length control protein FliK [Paenibacillus sp. GP183]|uniref:flagellar hook-length control protein FliK n=1 Tax=Paenibacillus sp. GP183 TaxID=1882751 RepID=UPI00089578FC|nr:flagellar hook-length control protein FliK [Paenibacillus sp. GP183]SEB46796.1 flagellar hook-length control protein FliK [Paenibacillus sp. GP183]